MMYFGGPGTVLSCLLALIVLNGFVVVTPWWLSHWVDAMSGDEVTNVAFYLGGYIIINMCSTVLHGLVVLLFSYGSSVAARRLHDSLISSVMNVSLSWYKHTPISRIINRLSAGMDSLDQSLGQQLLGFLDELIGVLFQIGAVSSIFPIFLIPSAIATIGGCVCGEMYSRTAVIVQRLVSASRSPINSHLLTAYRVSPSFEPSRTGRVTF